MASHPLNVLIRHLRGGRRTDRRATAGALRPPSRRGGHRGAGL